MYASQKNQVSSSLRRPETHFRHAQGHQRAVALTSCINIFQNTNITVYEAEARRQLTQNFENGLIGFRKKSKTYLITTFGGAKLEDTKNRE